MNAVNTGGPAFPTGTGITPYNPGMTLRDYFAAKAMGSLLSTLALKNLDMTPENAAALAYRRADAMMKARTA
jgi:hypothetical protein